MLHAQGLRSPKLGHPADPTDLHLSRPESLRGDAGSEFDCNMAACKPRVIAFSMIVPAATRNGLCNLSENRSASASF